MDELKKNNKIEKENKGELIEAVFPDFFDDLPDNVKYLNNLDYLKKSKTKITDSIIELFTEEGIVGIIDFVIINKPVQHCLLRDLEIKSNFLGKKYGSLLIELFNYFLRIKQLAGVLQNGVDITGDAMNYKTHMTSRFYSLLHFYKNHGWEALSIVNDIPNYMVYNCSDEDSNKLKKIYCG